jgi:hypothetical protein
MADAAAASAAKSAAAPVDPETAAKALASVTPLGKEMARALMWLVDECITCAALSFQADCPPRCFLGRDCGLSSVRAVLSLLHEADAALVCRGVALELQQEAQTGTLSLDGEVCQVVRDAAVADDPAVAALKSEGLALRSPMYCDTRRDLNDKPGYDCFGQPLMSAAGDKSTENVACPNCGQKTGAARFAPHLQRCMGGGRNASTSRRSTTPVRT